VAREEFIMSRAKSTDRVRYAKIIKRFIDAKLAKTPYRKMKAVDKEKLYRQLLNKKPDGANNNKWANGFRDAMGKTIRDFFG
jgi:hypothetical protein